MMSYARRQNINKVLIVAFSAGVIINSTIAYLAFRNAVDFTPDLSSSIEKRLHFECSRSLRTTGHKIVGMDTKWIEAVSSDGLEDPGVSIGRSSLGIQGCIGYELQEFCMGEDCEDGEIAFKLRASF